MVNSTSAPEIGEVVLEATDLWFAYDEGPSVLQGVSLEIKVGDFVALIGQNGSGKTTLAKHFNGLLRPIRGRVLLHGEDSRERSVAYLARTVGYVFQNPDHQIFSATTREEIAFGPRNIGLEESEVQRRTEQALEYFDLTAYADHQPAILGFGLRRKVSIAAVYAMRTGVLILDEPTAGLDWKSTHELMQRVGDLHRKGHTIILITHDMRLVAQYAPHCMVLRDGNILASGDTKAIFKQADLLKETHIELPQICQLARRLEPLNLKGDILTVAEFLERYDNLVERSEIKHAGRR
jgi:energy-coupling factor transport system ATP-binding protein